VLDRFSEEVAVPARVLDAGCGVGLDTEILLARGYDVTGIDASAGMIAEARRRVPGGSFAVCSLEALGGAGLGPFDAALVDFGVLNCVALERAAPALAGVLRPGGRLVLVVMPRIHPSFVLSRISRGNVRGGLERFRRRVRLPLTGGDEIATSYLSPRDVERAFGAWFQLRRVESLGLFLPPPGSSWPEPVLTILWGVEHRLRASPVLRSMGDHVLLILERA
jgi:SAM-dependent methyltransferase